MAVDLLAKLRELLANADDGDGVGESDADEVEADEVEAEADEAEADDAEVDADEVEAEADEAEADDAEVDADEVEQAGDGAADAVEAEADDADETMPESEVAESELRDALVTLGAENESLRATNEALRTRLAELGGDTEVDALDVDDHAGGTEADVPDKYDDDDAAADLAEQHAAIASLRG